VVGEPTLMGGEFGDKDERLIARLENTQYEPSEQPDECGNDPTSEHCVRPLPGTSAAPAVGFGAAQSVFAAGAQTRAPRPCLTASPTAIQTQWAIEKFMVPPGLPQAAAAAIPNDKLPTE